jgi:transposase
VESWRLLRQPFFYYAICGNFGKRTIMETRTFGTMTPDLLELSDWLSYYGCTHAAMESSGIYWKPVYNILESDFETMVVNAKHIKNVPGRKTDVKDSEWIAQLLRKGLLKASFIPPKPIRELRDLTRYRKKLIYQRTGERNRIHKILEDANIKLSSVLSDIFGMSGSRILKAVLLGRSLSTEELEQMAHGRVKPKIPELIKAIQGKLSDHHRFMIETIMSHIESLEECIAEIETEIESILVAYNDDIERLDTIPGVPRAGLSERHLGEP